MGSDCISTVLIIAYLFTLKKNFYKYRLIHYSFIHSVILPVNGCRGTTDNF